ncbi:hypothetical protein BGW38_003746 [Lunasporangiospora selenospora]|uniref:DUF4604 domain-containing protein n=1 Tax=Lunasporangiospora selenospora TaxID=979761 RepID=A0A9P6KCM5_9FUNG|nr:hypothetical protein BGW38_003746 [Lunasporangiospora selenospora]
MAEKKHTPHQIRKGLAYVQHGPDFMRMLTGQTSNAADKDPRNPYRKPIGIDAKFQHEQDDDDDDDPTVVVLKDKKHLDERQVRNILSNLPPGKCGILLCLFPTGLSESEIQKRLAEALSQAEQDGDNDDNSNNNNGGDSSSEEEAEPVDANGKILFRRPKGTKSKSKTTTSSSTASTPSKTVGSKKDFEETLLAEAQAKANHLKRKSADPSVTDAKPLPKGNKPKGGEASALKKKKVAKAAPTSLLSFDDEE